MTNYEHLMSQAEYCEEQCRATKDSYMKEFWAKTAKQYYSMARRLTTTEAATPYKGKAF